MDFAFTGTLPVAQPAAIDEDYFCQCGLLTSDGQFAYTPTWCKEYCLDNAQAALAGRKSLYVSSERKVHTDEVWWGMRTRRTLNCLEFINRVEDIIGFPRSSAHGIGGDWTVFRSPPGWLLSPPMLSMYTLLVRAGRLHELGARAEDTLDMFWAVPAGQVRPLDARCLKEAWAGIMAVLVHGPAAVFGNDVKKNWSGNVFIHNCGIAAFSLGGLRDHHPDWYRLLPR